MEGKDTSGERKKKNKQPKRDKPVLCHTIDDRDFGGGLGELPITRWKCVVFQPYMGGKEVIRAPQSTSTNEIRDTA